VSEDLAVRLWDAGWDVRTSSSAFGRGRRLIEMLRAVWRWRREYEVCHCDVFSGPAFFWALSVTTLLRTLGKPYVLTLRGGNLPEFAGRWPRLVRHVLGNARTVTAPSEYLLRGVREVRSDVRLLPNPIDLARYPFAARDKPGPRLVWLRAFSAIYNPSLAVRVLARLTSEFPGIALTMIGPDKSDGSLEDTVSVAAELGVSDRVRIVAGVPKGEVGARLSSADILLNTTNVDNVPVTVIEALACGLCVVSTNVGGMPFLVRHRESALLVEPADVEAMAGAVRSVLTEPGLAGRLSHNGRRLAETFDWSRVFPMWQSVLRDADPTAEPAGADGAAALGRPGRG
jgi:glycosyltransferase involved in cell wall biosynthesis